MADIWLAPGTPIGAKLLSREDYTVKCFGLDSGIPSETRVVVVEDAGSLSKSEVLSLWESLVRDKVNQMWICTGLPLLAPLSKYLTFAVIDQPGQVSVAGHDQCFKIAHSVGIEASAGTVLARTGSRGSAVVWEYRPVSSAGLLVITTLQLLHVSPFTSELSRRTILRWVLERLLDSYTNRPPPAAEKQGITDDQLHASVLCLALAEHVGGDEYAVKLVRDALGISLESISLGAAKQWLAGQGWEVSHALQILGLSGFLRRLVARGVNQDGS